MTELNINYLYNCDCLSISNLGITVSKNINLLLGKLHEYINSEGIKFLEKKIKITDRTEEVLNKISNLKIFLELSERKF